MPLVRDQLGREVSCPESPKRIISLVPSQTELLHFLGTADRVVGITKFCIHPQEWFHSKPRVGGTKTIDIDKIRALSPDLILANKEENDKDMIDQLSREFPVWISDIRSIDDAEGMIAAIGELTLTQVKAAELLKHISALRSENPKATVPISALYLIWNEPIMAVGPDTYIDSIMRYAGFKNVIRSTRYPELNLEQIHDLKPELILYSSEPFPFKMQHTDRLRAILPNAQHLLVDGEAFSWYGSRIPIALSYVNTIRDRIGY